VTGPADGVPMSDDPHLPRVPDLPDLPDLPGVPHAADEPPPLQRAAVQPRGLRSSGTLDSVGSVAGFILGNKLGGLGLAIALVTAWSLVAIVRRARNGIAIGKLLPITTAYLVARGVIGLVTGSKAVYFGTSIGTKVGIGLVLIGSAAMGRSLLGRYAPVVIPFPAFVLEHVRYRRTMRNLTVLAGVYEIGTAVWDVWLYNRTSTNGFVLIRLLVSWVSGFVTIFGGILYADLSLRKIPGFDGLLAVLEEATEALGGKPRGAPAPDA
jgi:hypothetical protein